MTSPVPAVVDRIPLPGPPEYLVYFNGLIYASIDNGRVVKVDSTTKEMLLDAVDGTERLVLLDFHRTIPNPDLIGPGEPDRRIYVMKAGAGAAALIEIVPGRFDTHRELLLGPDAGAVDIAAGPTGGVLYYADYGNSRVGVFDPDAGTTVATIPVPLGPEKLAVSRDGRFVLVMCEGGGKLIAIDTAQSPPDASLLNVNLGVATQLAVTPDLRLIAGQTFAKVVLIHDLQSQRTERVEVAREPNHVIVNATGKVAYSSNHDSSSVCVIDLSLQRTVHTIFGFAKPRGMCFSDDNKTLYVANSGSNDISVVAL